MGAGLPPCVTDSAASVPVATSGRHDAGVDGLLYGVRLILGQRAVGDGFAEVRLPVG